MNLSLILARWGASLVAITILAAAVGAPAGTPPERPVQYVFGISPFLRHDAKDAVYRGIVRFVLEDMTPNSSLRLYDAYHLRTISEIVIPDVQAFRSAKTRANQFRDRVGELRRFLAASPERPQVQDVDFQDAVRLPQFLDFVGENLVRSGESLAVLILGSPLYLDEKEPGFSMAHGYFPSDGHLAADRERSVFAVKERGRQLEGVAVLLAYFGDPWVSEIHQQKVGRFWSLFLEQQGARLLTFTGDLPTAFTAIRNDAARGRDASPTQELDRTHAKVEMLRITRDPGVSDWITRDLDGLRPPAPPSTTVGPLKIGIRWQGDVDLDLYARPHRDAETLYFRHTRSPEGYYFKDHRSSPDREYEFIEFQSPVDVRQLQAHVNFYEGQLSGGAEGEVRVEFEGRIYAGRFTLSTSKGNKGRAGAGQEASWATFDIPRILGLTSEPTETARRSTNTRRER